MARPQKENGYTPIANEILDEICQFAFNGTQFRIIIKVWRLTYGFGRKDHDLSVSYLASLTGISERTTKKEVAALIKAKVFQVTQPATKNTSRKLAFNKNYEEWRIKKSGGEIVFENFSSIYKEGSNPSPQTIESEGSNPSPREGSDTSPHPPILRGAIAPPYKEKDLLKKSIKEKESMFEIFWSVYPRKVSKQPALKSWNKLCKEKDFDPEIVIRNTGNYAETHKLLETKPNFILHPSTYLNQKRYEDYPTVDPEGIAVAGRGGFDSNLDFFKQQLGGGGDDPGASSPALDEGFGRLPE